MQVQLEPETDTRLPPLQTPHLHPQPHGSQKRLRSDQKVPSSNYLQFKQDPFFQRVDKQIYEHSTLSTKKKSIYELRQLSIQKQGARLEESRKSESVRHRSQRTDIRALAELPQSERHKKPHVDMSWMQRSRKDKWTSGGMVGVQLGKCKESSRPVGIVSAYCANTHQGLVRKYNEDRVSIVLNMTPPRKKSDWPRCSLFAIFDGHGGTRCADFLRDNLHQLLITEPTLATDPEVALKSAILAAEDLFTKHCLAQNQLDRSGTCALVVLLVDDTLVVANVGDSRAFLVKNKGRTIRELTQDHKPSLLSEHTRIVDKGGQVYQSTIRNQSGGVFMGPMRVLPGRLSVSRTLGDIEAKTPQFGGLPDVISAEPEMCKVDLTKEKADFLFMGCDGIFDRMSNEDVLKQSFISYLEQPNQQPSQPTQSFLRQAVLGTIHQAFLRRTTDNVTVLVLAFSALSSTLEALSSSQQVQCLVPQVETFQP